jgi:hypothetical protein
MDLGCETIGFFNVEYPFGRVFSRLFPKGIQHIGLFVPKLRALES